MQQHSVLHRPQQDALALRTKAPVFVHPVVLEKAQADDGTTEEERVKKILEDLDVEDLGKYKM